MPKSNYLRASDLEAATHGLIDEKRAYKLVQSHVLRPPCVLRLGRRLYFHRERLLEFLEAGGSGLDGGWRHAKAGETEAADHAG